MLRLQLFLFSCLFVLVFSENIHRNNKDVNSQVIPVRTRRHLRKHIGIGPSKQQVSFLQVQNKADPADAEGAVSEDDAGCGGAAGDKQGTSKEESDPAAQEEEESQEGISINIYQRDSLFCTSIPASIYLFFSRYDLYIYNILKVTE